MSKIILTGDRPTGRLHVGHYVGSLAERVKLQNSGLYDEIYIMIADAQALTDNAEHPPAPALRFGPGSSARIRGFFCSFPCPVLLPERPAVEDRKSVV